MTEINQFQKGKWLLEPDQESVSVIRTQLPCSSAKMSQLNRKLIKSRSALDLFRSSCRFLSDFFPLSRASLAFYDPIEEAFTVSLLKVGKEYLTGVAFRLEPDSSLFTAAMVTGDVIVENLPFSARISFLESKLLLGPDTKSIAIVPLYDQYQFLGVYSIGTSQFSSLEKYSNSLLPEFSRIIAFHFRTHLQ